MIIYKTTNIVNNKIYIGKQVKHNPEYIGSGILLSRAIEKYGKENFTKEILEVCETKAILNEREIYWIEKLQSRDKTIGYNIAKGGEGGWAGNELRTDEEYLLTAKKSLETMGKEGLSNRSKKINDNLGELGRKNRSKKGRETMGPEGLSKRAKKTMETLGNNWLNKKAIEKLGPDGLSERSKKAMETLGKEGKYLKAQKSNHTRYHTNMNIYNPSCVHCTK